MVRILWHLGSESFRRAGGVSPLFSNHRSGSRQQVRAYSVSSEDVMNLFSNHRSGSRQQVRAYSVSSEDVMNLFSNHRSGSRQQGAYAPRSPM